MEAKYGGKTRDWSEKELIGEVVCGFEQAFSVIDKQQSWEALRKHSRFFVGDGEWVGMHY